MVIKYWRIEKHQPLAIIRVKLNMQQRQISKIFLSLPLWLVFSSMWLWISFYCSLHCFKCFFLSSCHLIATNKSTFPGTALLLSPQKYYYGKQPSKKPKKRQKSSQKIKLFPKPVFALWSINLKTMRPVFFILVCWWAFKAVLFKIIFLFLYFYFAYSILIFFYLYLPFW